MKMRGICTNPPRKPIEEEIGYDYHDLKINYKYHTVRGILLHLRKTKILPLYDNKSVEIIRCQQSTAYYETLVLLCKCDEWPYVFKVILIWNHENRYVYEIIKNSREKDEKLAIKCYNDHGGDYYAPLEENEIDYRDNYIF